MWVYTWGIYNESDQLIIYDKLEVLLVNYVILQYQSIKKKYMGVVDLTIYMRSISSDHLNKKLWIEI